MCTCSLLVSVFYVSQFNCVHSITGYLILRVCFFRIVSWVLCGSPSGRSCWILWGMTGRKLAKWIYMTSHVVDLFLSILRKINTKGFLRWCFLKKILADCLTVWAVFDVAGQEHVNVKEPELSDGISAVFLRSQPAGWAHLGRWCG